MVKHLVFLYIKPRQNSGQIRIFQKYPYTGDGGRARGSRFVSMAKAAGMAPAIQRTKTRKVSTLLKASRGVGANKKIFTGPERAKAQPAQMGMRCNRASRMPMRTELSM